MSDGNSGDEKKMKVLHVITGLSQGGAENALFRLVTYKPARVTHIVISTIDAGVYGPKLINAGISVFTLGMTRGHLKISGIFKLWKLIRKEKPDVVQTWMYHADLIGGITARLAGCSSVCWGVHTFNLDAAVMSKSTRTIVKLCALTSWIVPSRIISVAESSVRVHVAVGYTKNKFLTIPLGFNSDVGEGNTPKGTGMINFINKSDKVTILGCVARWDPQKDHGNLLQALAILQHRKIEFKCIFVGPGMDYQNRTLSDLVLKMKVNSENIFLAGFVEGASSIMSSFDLHILSSLGEAFANVVAEAMISGTPCICTDVGDVALVVGETGWIVPPSDPVALASAIEDAISEMNDRIKWSARKEACKKYIKDNYSIERMVDSYFRVWNSVRKNR